MTDRIIVIVDDSRLSLRVLKDEIERLTNNVSIKITTDSKEALSIINKHTERVVLITDNIMPSTEPPYNLVERGMELIEELRQNQDTKKVPVFLITALINNELLDKINNLDVEMILSKPLIKKDILRTKLNNLLKKEEDGDDRN